MQIKIEIVTESVKEAADVLAKVAGTAKQKEILRDNPEYPGDE
jgi:glycine cleavage system H lipoate-binding protein